MPLSCDVSCLGRWRLERALARIGDAGYEGVQFSWAPVRRALAAGEELVPRLHALLRAHGLRFSHVAVSDLNVADADGLPTWTHELVAQMWLAGALHAPAVSLRAGERRSQTLDVLVRGLELILPTADKLDLAVELVNANGSRAEQLEDLRHVFSHLRHPRLWLVNDTGEFHDACVNPRDAFREFIYRTNAVRIADRVGRRPVPLGQGEVNVPAIVEHLQRVGYTGWLIVGPPVPDSMTAAQYLAQAADYLRSLMR